VVVMFSQVLRELEARPLVGGHDPLYDPGLFQHGEVPVDGTLRQVAAMSEDLGDRERGRHRREQLDELAAVAGVALAGPA